MAQLITDIETFKANFGAIDANLSWQSLKPSVDDVERDIIAETLGDDVVTSFTAQNLTPNQTKAFAFLQRATAYLSILKWSETAMFRFTDKALYIAKNGDGVIPSDKKTRDLKAFCEESGYNFLDKAIGLMESDLASFPAYAASDLRQTMMQGFIKTAQDFSRQRNINNSRITFISMLEIMLDVQERVLPDALGLTYYPLFKERYLDGDLTPNEEKLLPLIKKAVAHFTVSEACKNQRVKLTAKGLFVNQYANRSEYEQQDAADLARIQFTVDDELDKGETRLNDIRAYLLANFASFPDFVAPVIVHHCHNRRDSGLFYL